MRVLLQVVALFLASLWGIVARPQQNGIRQIDFKNFAYPWTNESDGGGTTYWHWIRSAPRLTIIVVDGRYTFSDLDDADGGPLPTIFFKSVTYGDLVGDGSELAAVRLNYSTGGTNNWDYLYVYKLEHGTPKLCAWLQSGSRAYGGLVRVSIENRLLKLDFLDAARRVGDCCSEGFIRVNYRWRHGEFVETGARERGDLKLDSR